MLGARARAAEYHAAKAASARQQANQDEDEQNIPKPAPISLSAFTRNAFSNRNKGTKTFKPLVLSEEEERRSTSSVDLGSDMDHSSSPRPEIPDPPRAASVPAPQPLATGIHAQFERSVQTPYRYRDPHMTSMATRTMFPDDGYAFPPHALALPPQYLPQPYHTQSVMQQSMIPTPPAGWYMQPDYYATHHSPHDAGMPPVAPLPDARPATRPQIPHFDSAEPYIQHEPEQKSSSEHTPADQPNTPPKLGGQRLFVFGPDDLSPTKIELKQQAREKYVADHGSILPTPTTGMADRSVSTPKPLEVVDEDELMRYLQITGQARLLAQHKGSGNLQDLLVDRDPTASTRRQTKHADSGSWNFQAVDQHDGPALAGKNEADWPYLGQSHSYHGKENGFDATPAKQVSTGEKHNVAIDIKQILDSMRAKAGSPVTVRPPPGLERTVAKSNKPREPQREQMTNISFPLVDMDSSEWLDVRMPTEVERDRMRRLCHTVQTSSISDKYRDAKDVGDGTVQGELKRWTEIQVRDMESRRERVEELAAEMQRKWEYGGSFRSASMSKIDAERHARTVKAIGGMMAALSMQVEDSTGASQRGARPYCQAPEYAIERSVESGKSTSLFESDDDASMTAPLRLARDPRFRPQLTEGLKVAAEEGRIPRMFAARRVM